MQGKLKVFADISKVAALKSDQEFADNVREFRQVGR
jgi:hypothetical protein